MLQRFLLKTPKKVLTKSDYLFTFDSVTKSGQLFSQLYSVPVTKQIPWQSQIRDGLQNSCLMVFQGIEFYGNMVLDRLPLDSRNLLSRKGRITDSHSS